ncbi:MAG: branched-chain amino acid ABC transporter permease [Actinomycetota bacterium]|nr:branched-chain amino acid ABC transporter permease [Actinomycetota bacterium]MDA8207775.1 branched-chain amino acid ABC transporter permease [Actinomycetota bacterium]
MVTDFIRAVIDGVLSGSVYALMAAGLTLIFGVMEVINVAQGILVILGAYLSYVLSVHLGIDLFAGLIITIPVMFILGVGIQWGLMSRLGEREKVSMSILVTYAVAIILEGALDLIFGPSYQQLTAWYVNQSMHVLGFYLPYIYVFGFLLAVVLLGALYFILYRTEFGRSLRAAQQNRTAARLIGIDVNRVSAITFGIGVAVTAAGGMVFGATTSFNANSSADLISRLLTIIILGGMGSIGGAMGASVLMLVVEALVSTFWSPTWATLVFYAVLVVVLAVRPAGLFGQKAVRAQ